jgi:hypothetical protein
MSRCGPILWMESKKVLCTRAHPAAKTSFGQPNGREGAEYPEKIWQSA